MVCLQIFSMVYRFTYSVTMLNDQRVASTVRFEMIILCGFGWRISHIIARMEPYPKGIQGINYYRLIKPPAPIHLLGRFLHNSQHVIYHYLNNIKTRILSLSYPPLIGWTMDSLALNTPGSIFQFIPYPYPYPQFRIWPWFCVDQDINDTTPLLIC